MFSSLPLIFPPTVVGNITASVALILWTNGQLPPPTKELKKLAPDHFSPGASCGHSRGREIFGLLNCFSASIASLIGSLFLSLEPSLSRNWLLCSNQMGAGNVPRLGVGTVSPGVQGWDGKGSQPPPQQLPRCASIPYDFQILGSDRTWSETIRAGRSLGSWGGVGGS